MVGSGQAGDSYKRAHPIHGGSTMTSPGPLDLQGPTSSDRHPERVGAGWGATIRPIATGGASVVRALC